MRQRERAIEAVALPRWIPYGSYRSDGNGQRAVTTSENHLERGRKTRRRVLQRAVQIATREGLEALTIGRLAEEVGLTKAGLLGHFGTKQALQLATLQAGQREFVEAVVGEEESSDLAGLVRLLDRWLETGAQKPGGCFFASVAAEFDAKPGPVRDSVAALVSAWMGELSARVEAAQRARQLKRDISPRDLAMGLYGVELVMNLRRQLLDDASALKDGRRAMRALLLAHATPSGGRLLHALR